MDLERLTKHQIILLTLLISFVTSMATGIVAVSLMSQAPPSVTRVINQIVERTVQSVTPGNSQNAASVSSQKTVVVKDDDLVVNTISKLQKSIIKITAKGGIELIARGVIVNKNGEALTDREALVKSGATDFEAILASGERVVLTPHFTEATTSPLLSVSLGTSTTIGYIVSPVTAVSKLRLGQAVLRIGGAGVDSVATGVIAMLPTGTSTEATIEASVESTTPGALLATQFGEVIALSTSDSRLQSADSYSPLSNMPSLSAQETKVSSQP